MPQDTNPIAVETVDRYAAQTWGTTGGTEDFTTPSGQLCLIRKIDVQGLMQAGLMNDLDAIMSVVGNKHIMKAKGVRTVDMEKALEKPEMMTRLMHLIDRTVTHIVVKPEVQMAPNDVTKRKQGVIYTDMISLEDKSAIFEYATSEIEDAATFRTDADGDVGAVDDEPSAPVPPKQPRKRK